jgi:hypothetical protein
MKKIALSLTAVALGFACLVFAEDKYKVSGEVVCSGDSKIYVCLHNLTTFAAFAGRQKELPPSGFMNIVKADRAGKAPFAFKDVSKGEYVIVAFADENNNGKFDCDTWGMPLEPICSYKVPPHRDLSWHDQKFEVDKDISGLVLKFRD